MVWKTNEFNKVEGRDSIHTSGTTSGSEISVVENMRNPGQR